MAKGRHPADKQDRMRVNGKKKKLGKKPSRTRQIAKEEFEDKETRDELTQFLKLSEGSD